MSTDQDRIAMMTAALANVSGALIDAGATWTDYPCNYGQKIRHEIEFRDLRIQLLEFELAICERAATGVLGKNDRIAPALGFTRAFAAIIELRDRLDAYLYADGQVDEQGNPINRDSTSSAVEGLGSDDDKLCDDCCAPEGQCGEDCPQYVPRKLDRGTWRGDQRGPAFGNTDDAPPALVLAALRQCASSWEGGVRVLGNIRAQDIVRAIDELGATTRGPNAAHHPDPFEVPPRTPAEQEWWVGLPTCQWCPKCRDRNAPCCNPQCDGNWPTGCFHCHHPMYGEHPTDYKEKT